MENIDLRIPQLSTKAAQRGLHVVHVNLGVSGSPLMEDSFQPAAGGRQPGGTGPRNGRRGTKRNYRSAPFAVEGEATVVDPFV